MGWLGISVVLMMCSQAASASDLTVHVFSTTSKTAILRWTKYAGAVSYKITVFPKSSPDTSVAFARFGPDTVMGSVNSLSPNTAYVFTVEALDDLEEVLSGADVEWKTAPDVMDPIRTVKPKDSRTLIVEFGARNGATRYVVRVQSADGFTREDKVYGSPAEIRFLRPYTEYTLSIMAESDGGRSQPSGSVTAKTVLPPPELSASSPSNDSIAVSWVPVDHAVRYTLSVRQPGSDSVWKQNASESSAIFSGLDPGSLYVISGFAWDPEGRKGDRSADANQTTRPPAPSGVDVSVSANGSLAALTVSWELRPEPHGPVWFRVTSDRNLTCDTADSSCALTPVGCGEVHAVLVVAWNEAGPSHPSGPVSFTTFPCPPESPALEESPEGNCTLTWEAAPHADGYLAYVKRYDGHEETCNTTGLDCAFRCQCGFTYLMSVFASNRAGVGPPGPVVNHTTLPCCPEDVSVSLVGYDALEITWAAARGAEVYRTRAADGSEVILCNDTAPVCALSDLGCDRTYGVVVTPCNDVSGCNMACQTHAEETAPCTPESLRLEMKNSTCVGVSWTASNRAATYTASASDADGIYTCASDGGDCDIGGLPCGSVLEVSVTATGAAGRSLPSYSQTLETDPCCPPELTVDQVTQAMTNVSWSHAKGAQTFLASLSSPRGRARCRTRDSHCLMGCITCGTTYTVTVEADSQSGRRTTCTYEGFSSSACCPSGVRLYRLSGNSIRVYWRAAASGRQGYVADLAGGGNNYTCTASPGGSSCDIDGVQCGKVFNVDVAPLTPGGGKVLFCPQRLYSVTCTGSDIATVIYRGKRSVDEQLLLNAN